MSFEEMVVALVGTVAGVGLVGYLAGKVFGLIKAWINRNNSSIPEESFNRLAKAFMDHKKDANRRLQNLEAIISEEDSKSNSRDQSKQIEASKNTIEIEEQEIKGEKPQSGNDANLRNMLRE